MLKRLLDMASVALASCVVLAFAVTVQPWDHRNAEFGSDGTPWGRVEAGPAAW